MTGWGRWSTGNCSSYHTKKWLMHNPESALENETQKVDIQNPLISTRQSDLVIINKKKKKKKRKKKKKEKKRPCLIVDFAVPADLRVKLKEREKRGKYQDLAREVKNMEHESDCDNNCNRCAWNNHQKIEIRRHVETIETTVLLRSARILRRVLETWDLLSLKCQWRTIS